MTLSVSEERRFQCDLAQLVAQGDIVKVVDPDSGEVYYGATQKLLDRYKEEAAANERAQPNRRSRHAKPSAPRGWWLRLVMVGAAVSVVMVASLPAVMSLAKRPAIERIIDDEEPVSSVTPVAPSFPPSVMRGEPQAEPPVTAQAAGPRWWHFSALGRPAGRHRARKSLFRSRVERGIPGSMALSA